MELRVIFQVILLVWITAGARVVVLKFTITALLAEVVMSI
jgi:hypothetical protein